MKRWKDRLLTGYLIQVCLMIIFLIVSFIAEFFDSFYNRILIKWMIGKKVPAAGFALSLIIALLVGTLADTKIGWMIISRFLNSNPVTRWIINAVEQWKIFIMIAHEQGVILANYYRKEMFYPGIVTGVQPTNQKGNLITVTFGDLPIPRPFFLSEDEIIYSSLSFGEAFAYMISAGLALRKLKRKLHKQTLKEYVEKSGKFYQGDL